LSLSAGLADQEAHWRFDVLMASARGPVRRSNYAAGVQPFVDLQRRRGRFVELGAQMEQYAAAVPREERDMPLIAAAHAYYSASDSENELRLLASIFTVHGLDTNRQQRFFQLSLQKQPQELVRIASIWPGTAGEAAANYAVAHASATLAHAVVQARSKVRPPIWNRAYNALVGLYFDETAPEVNNAFLGALGDETIAARLAQPADRDQ